MNPLPESASLARFEAALAAALAARGLGPAAGLLAAGDAIPERHFQDWSRMPPVRPLALARPRGTAEVSALLAAAAEARVPVVPQGGLTGLVGGAHPVAGALALSLERMSGVEEVDAEGATMTVLAGTTLAEAQSAAEAAGLLLALDLPSRGSCTIGGNIATNAGGVRVIRHGAAREQVLGLEAVLAGGEVISSMNRLVKNNTGYDLKHLFIGSEGTLGVVTRAVMRLQPRPAAVETALCSVPDYGALLALLGGLRARVGPALTGFEAMWPEFVERMVATFGLRSHFPGPRLLALVETSRFGASEPPRLAAALESLMAEGVVADALVAQSGREAAEFWRLREIAGEFRSAVGPIVSYDIGLSAAETGRFVELSAARIRARWPDAIHLAFGHLGDNNLHLILRAPGAGASQPKEAFDEMVYEAVREFGGSVSAEHGIGLSKRRYLAYSRNPGEIWMMARIKWTLDPLGLMNPGKLIAGRQCGTASPGTVDIEPPEGETVAF